MNTGTGFTMRPTHQSPEARPIPPAAPRWSEYEKELDEDIVLTCAETPAETGNTKECPKENTQKRGRNSPTQVDEARHNSKDQGHLIPQS